MGATMGVINRVRMGISARVIGGIFAAAVALTGLARAGGAADDESQVRQLTFGNPSGVQRTITTAGSIDFTNPFFQDLGTNGRTCFTCHRPAEAWSITPDEIRARFEDTRGLDPLFRTNDGSTCEGADVSSLRKRRTAFSLLLTKGLIRVGLPVPADAEFAIVDVDDPYRCGALFTEASLYRRPPPTTNLRFLSAIMWDGRESVTGHSIQADLLTQARDATTGHAEGAAPQPFQLQQIVDFEMGLFTAQVLDNLAGRLHGAGASGGPRTLTTQPFCIGINDPLNMLPSMPGACPTASGGLDPVVFTIFQPWEHVKSPARQAIARGETIFNTRTFTIDNVAGLNGGPQDPLAGPIQGGTCTICHDTPNVGNHSVAMALNIGIADASRRTADLPLYTLQNKTTNEIVQTTDPGRAMVTGKWSDIGKFKGPILRALAARAPYFHDGSAASLEDAVDFYDTRFHVGFTDQEKADLVAFLKAL